MSSNDIHGGLWSAKDFLFKYAPSKAKFLLNKHLYSGDQDYGWHVTQLLNARYTLEALLEVYNDARSIKYRDKWFQPKLDERKQAAIQFCSFIHEHLHNAHEVKEEDD